MIPEITSKEDLINLRDTIITATITDGPYRKCRCKQCKDTFYLSSGEVEFFRQKEFKMPKICKYCKKGIEKPKKETTKPIIQKVEEEGPTEMEKLLSKVWKK
jgi:NAD-dependent SIR2 family protein deacetylase